MRCQQKPAHLLPLVAAKGEANVGRQKNDDFMNAKIQKALRLLLYLIICAAFGGVVATVGFGCASYGLFVIGLVSKEALIPMTLAATISFALLGVGLGINIIRKRNCQQ